MTNNDHANGNDNVTGNVWFNESAIAGNATDSTAFTGTSISKSKAMSATGRALRSSVVSERNRRSTIRPGSMVDLENKPINMNIPTNTQIKDHVEDKHGIDSWKMKTLNFLHQHHVQTIFMVLLILDVLFLFVEMFLMSLFPMCNIVMTNCHACCPTSTEVAAEKAEEDEHRFLLRLLAGGGGDGYHHDLCEQGFVDSGTHENLLNESTMDDISSGYPACDHHKFSTVHLVENILFFGTITILSLFLLENLIECIAMGPLVFFKQIFLALDFFIVFVSLTLELWFHYHNEALQSVVGVLILIRVWRFVRYVSFKNGSHPFQRA